VAASSPAYPRTIGIRVEPTAQDAMESDRRKYPRLPSDQLVSFTPFAGAPALADGGDVSLGGIRLRVVGCKIRKGDLLRVNFNVGEQTIEGVGRVVWIREMDDITAEIGLEFVRIDPWAARLLDEELERQQAEVGE
jgi:hypothetical protein